MVITFVDITNIKAAEQALAYSRERYRLMVESTREYAMFTMDENGVIDTWNQGARRIFGYEEAEIVGRSGVIIFTPEDRAAGIVEKELALARQDGSSANERWHVRKDGSRFWSSGVVTVLRDGPELRGYAKVMRDNTVRKEAEEALRQSKEALQSLNETLEQKVDERTKSLQQRSEQVRGLAEQLTMAEQEERGRIAQVLHDDLQQRLFAVQMQLSFVREAHENEDGDAFRREFEQIEKDVEDVIHTTRQLNVNLSPPILHDEGLTEAISWLASHMREEHELEVSIEAEESFAITDEGLRVLLFQAVRELLFNVVKHANTHEATVRLEEAEGKLYITVLDGGRGFDRELLASKRHQGSGLATMRHRLGLVGAEISIETEPGSGARVTIDAPLER